MPPARRRADGAAGRDGGRRRGRALGRRPPTAAAQSRRRPRQPRRRPAPARPTRCAEARRRPSRPPARRRRADLAPEVSAGAGHPAGAARRLRQRGRWRAGRMGPRRRAGSATCSPASALVHRATAAERRRVFYRLRVAGFADERRRAAFCAVAAAERRDCIPVQRCTGMARRAVILGCAGPALVPDEAALLPRRPTPGASSSSPATSRRPAQLRRLTADLRAAVGRDAPVLIDQEGGRVQRLRAPHWREWLPPLDQVARRGRATARARCLAALPADRRANCARVGIDVELRAGAPTSRGRDTHPVSAQPLLWRLIADEVAADRPRRRRGAAGGRRAAGDEASARPWPRRRSTATSTCRAVAAAARRRWRRRFRAVPRAGRPADGDDRACRLSPRSIPTAPATAVGRA